MKVLITGITGFVGHALGESLLGHGWDVTGSVRFANDKPPLAEAGVQIFPTGEINGQTAWRQALYKVDVVVHLAARTHVMREYSQDPLSEFRLVNTLGTERLAKQAAEAGVKRFVYLSSIKVNGEETGLRIDDLGQHGSKGKSAFAESDSVNPLDPYALSKWEAEQSLQKISQETEMEVVIVRPPLIYGPGVKANFLRLLHLVSKGIPLPLNSVTNCRSMVYLDNLVDFLNTCIVHPRAGGEVLFVSDDEDLSTAELIRRIAFHMSKSARLLPCPVMMLRAGARLLGKKAEVDRLCGSLQVDISKAISLLGWQPPFTVDEGLKKTVEWYKQQD